MKLVKEEGIPVLQEIYSFDCTNEALPTFTRATQIKVPDGFVVANYLQDSKMLQARSPSVGLFHQVSVSEHVSDICPIYADTTHFFAALSQSRCRLFKLSLDY